MSMRPETFRSDELTTLMGFVEAQRDIVRAKTAGLSAQQLAITHPPSTMTLGGLLRHLTMVEHDWSVVFWSGLPPEEPWASAPWDEDDDWEWRWSADEDADSLRAAWEAACQRTNALILASPDLDAPPGREPYVDDEGPDAVVSRRFILVHLIEEIARHAGHADLLAEAIDGRVGQ
jgi:uncharacterized damage-inducible protein DinB